MEPAPKTIGRYVVETLVGTGAMGRIFKAHDPNIQRAVANSNFVLLDAKGHLPHLSAPELVIQEIKKFLQ